MDGLKLDKRQKSFEAEVKSLQTECYTFLLPKKFEDTYLSKIDETSHALSLWIDTQNVPKEIEEALSEAFIKSQPEQ